MEKNIVLLSNPDQESAKEAGVDKLKMAVWYDPDVPRDKEFGQRLMKTLEAIGCNVKDEDGRLRSPEDLPIGQDIRYSSARMFKNADIVHVVLSRDAISRRSQVFMPGLHSAKDASEEKIPGSIFIVPIKLDENSMPGMFKGMAALDLTSGGLHEMGQKLLKTWEKAAQENGYTS